jgi:hypothetical protein
MTEASVGGGPPNKQYLDSSSQLKIAKRLR